MYQSIDTIAGTATTPTLLLNKGNYVELRGTLEKPCHSQLKDECEAWVLKLEEAPGYEFQSGIPDSAVNTMNLLYAAIGTEVVLKSRRNSSKEGKEGVIIVELSYGSVNGYKIPFYNRKLLD